MSNGNARHRVIIRDDDTCGLTPPEFLERLYRPFLDASLPVNLATIPDVATGTTTPEGELEGFIQAGRKVSGKSAPIGEHTALLEYLAERPLFKIVHHGHDHRYFEFASDDREESERKLDAGRRMLDAAGLGSPGTFVAPYDQYRPAALKAIADRFSVFSTGWFDRARLPASWLPAYLLKKLRRAPHWRVGDTRLLTHPGCLLSYTRPYDTIFANVQRAVRSSDLTVLVTHWWEYFRDGGNPDEDLIETHHAVGRWLAEDPEVEVISFEDLSE